MSIDTLSQYRSDLPLPGEHAGCQADAAAAQAAGAPVHPRREHALLAALEADAQRELRRLTDNARRPAAGPWLDTLLGWELGRALPIVHTAER